MIIPIVLFSLVGLLFIVLGTILNKQSSSGNREANKLFVALMRLFGVAVIVVGNAYAVIDNKGWSTENTKMFATIAVLVPSIMMALMGIRFIRLNARGAGRSGAMFWTLLWLIMAGYGYVQISNSGQGWTEESKKKILDKVTPYDRICYLEQIMEMYPTPDVYNKKAVKDEEKISKRMEENCKVCDLGEAEAVDGLPDDF